MTITKSQTLGCATSFFLFSCIAIGKGYNYASVVLVLCALIALYPYRKIKVNADSRLFILALLCYFASFVITVLITQNSISDIDKPSRVILAIPIFLALIKYPPNFKSLAVGLIMSAYAVGCVGFYYALMHPNIRAFDDSVGGWWLKGYMQIQTGGMATTSFISCFVLSIHYFKNKNFKWAVTALGGAGMAMYASILSGTRGSWIFVPIAIVYLAYVNRKHFCKKTIVISIVSLLFVSGFLSQSSMFQERLNITKQEIALYVSNENRVTSLGIRLELWKSALYTFAENPVIGSGSKDRSTYRQAHGESGLIDKTVSLKTYHAHNQFLESLSVYGFIGFLGLLGIFFTPLYLFEKQRKIAYSAENKTLIEIGTVSIILMMGYCTTQAFLNHNSGMIYYIAFTSIFLATVLSDPSSKSLIKSVEESDEYT